MKKIFSLIISFLICIGVYFIFTTTYQQTKAASWLGFGRLSVRELKLLPDPLGKYKQRWNINNQSINCTALGLSNGCETSANSTTIKNKLLSQYGGCYFRDYELLRGVLTDSTYGNGSDFSQLVNNTVMICPGETSPLTGQVADYFEGAGTSGDPYRYIGELPSSTFVKGKSCKDFDLLASRMPNNNAPRGSGACIGGTKACLPNAVYRIDPDGNGGDNAYNVNCYFAGTLAGAGSSGDPYRFPGENAGDGYVQARNCQDYNLNFLRGSGSCYGRSCLNNGIYRIDPDGNGGNGAYNVYCDMNTNGGGWTMVLNLQTSDGSTRHREDTGFWTSSSTAGSVDNRFTADYKSDTFNSTPLDEIMMWAHNDGTYKGHATYKILPSYNNNTLYWLFNNVNNLTLTTSRLTNGGSVGNGGFGNVRGDAFIDHTDPIRINNSNGMGSEQNYFRLGINYSPYCGNIMSCNHSYGGWGGRHYNSSRGAYYEGAALGSYCSTYNGFGNNGSLYGGGNNAFNGCGSSGRDVDMALFGRNPYYMYLDGTIAKSCSDYYVNTSSSKKLNDLSTTAVNKAGIYIIDPDGVGASPAAPQYCDMKGLAMLSFKDGTYAPSCMNYYRMVSSTKPLNDNSTSAVGKDGIYKIDPDGAGGVSPFNVYCDMTTNGGGRTLVLNLQTSDQATRHREDTTFWTSTTTYGQLDQKFYKDFKSQAFNDANIEEIMMRAHNDGTYKGHAGYKVLGSFHNTSFYRIFNNVNNRTLTTSRLTNGGSVGNGGFGSNRGDVFIDHTDPIRINNSNGMGSEQSYIRLGINYSPYCGNGISCGHSFGGWGGRHYNGGRGAYYEGASLNSYCGSYGAYGTNGSLYGGGNNAFNGCGNSERDIDMAVFSKTSYMLYADGSYGTSCSDYYTNTSASKKLVDGSSSAVNKGGLYMINTGTGAFVKYCDMINLGSFTYQDGTYGTSCLNYYQNTSSSKKLNDNSTSAVNKNGVYKIDPDGGGSISPYDVYCDMTTNGGGRTLVLNLQTSDQATRHRDDTTFWTSTTTNGVVDQKYYKDFKSPAFNDVSAANGIMMRSHNDGTYNGYAAYSLLGSYQNKTMNWLFNNVTNTDITTSRQASAGSVGNGGFGSNRGDVFIDHGDPVRINNTNGMGSEQSYIRLGINYSPYCGNVITCGHSFGGWGGRHYNGGRGAYYEGASLNSYCGSYGAYGTNGSLYGGGNNAFNGCGNSEREYDMAMFIR